MSYGVLSFLRAPRSGARRVSAARYLEGGLWLVGLGCAGFIVSAALDARAADRFAQSIGKTQVQRSAAHGATDSNSTVPEATSVVHGDGAVMGRLEIPQVALSVPVLENYDPASLKRGVGHIPGTALPGGLGNLGLAGHRDTFFRPLRNVHTGMEIDVVTAEGKFRYQIDTTEIVTPEQVEVLDIRTRPELTLITCYPFNFIGSAPKRFIVHAHLLSLEPS